MTATVRVVAFCLMDWVVFRLPWLLDLDCLLDLGLLVFLFLISLDCLLSEFMASSLLFGIRFRDERRGAVSIQ